MEFALNPDYPRIADAHDALARFRKEFYLPFVHGREAVYFTGNSLGLQPKRTQDFILQELEDWANFGVEGHFHARNPWVSYHELFSESAARIVGALPQEVVIMNQLTVNLHLLMVSFYRPTKKRFKIICEAKAFPSDQYAIASQVEWHGFDPAEAIVEVAPRPGAHCISHEDIYAAITEHADTLALVLLGGVNYYSGQVFDMQTITTKAHEVGAVAGFDLAHAAGNVALNLHAWNVDFACWCTYKYLNSGPGSVAGAFIHERHHHEHLLRFAGWWGHDKVNRFKMDKTFVPIASAEGWQLSNAPVLSMAAHKASLEIFSEVGMPDLIAKARKLNAYADFAIQQINAQINNADLKLEVITPDLNGQHDYFDRGCQLSIVAHGFGKQLFNDLTAHGVIADWREPNVIRIAPVPLYNSFTDVYDFAEILKKLLLQ